MSMFMCFAGPPIREATQGPESAILFMVSISRYPQVDMVKKPGYPDCIVRLYGCRNR